MVKLRNNQTGEEIEKSEVNWNNLQKDLKAKYTVLDGAETSEGKGTLHFTPPELQEKKEEATTAADASTTVDAAAAEPAKGNEPETGDKAPADETQEQQIVRLYKAANPQTPKDIKTAISAIAKEVGAHFKSVEKVVNAIK